MMLFSKYIWIYKNHDFIYIDQKFEFYALWYNFEMLKLVCMTQFAQHNELVKLEQTMEPVVV